MNFYAGFWWSRGKGWAALFQTAWPGYKKKGLIYFSPFLIYNGLSSSLQPIMTANLRQPQNQTKPFFSK